MIRYLETNATVSWCQRPVDHEEKILAETRNLMTKVKVESVQNPQATFAFMKLINRNHETKVTTSGGPRLAHQNYLSEVERRVRFFVKSHV